MRIYPHINFGGKCEAAFQFYERCLGGKIETMLTWANSPMAKDVPAESQNRICHATLTVGTNELAGVDDPFEQYEPPRGFQLILDIDQPEESERIFELLAQNGTVIMPLGQTFWAARYGIVVDQFNVRWEVNCG